MSIVEQTGSFSVPKDQGFIVRSDIEQEEEARVYTHEELQEILGADYRSRIKAHLEATGKIPGGHPLEWLHPERDRDRYVHLGSSANYLLDQKVNGERDLLMVSVIPPGKATSSDHSHPGATEDNPNAVIEIYDCILGGFRLHADDLAILMMPGSPEQHIYPGVEHRVSVPENNWAIVSIYMKNGGLWDRDKLHIRKKK